MGSYGEGATVVVVAESIQRSDGAAWKGTTGRVLYRDGDGYCIQFPGSFIAKNVKEHEITAA